MTRLLALLRRLWGRRPVDDGYMRRVQHADPWPEMLRDPEFVERLRRAVDDERDAA